MYHGGDHSSHLLAKVGGFLFLPVLGTLATRLAAPAVENVAPKANPALVTAAVGTMAFGALAVAFHHMSESDNQSVSMQALFRGAMWGSGLAAVATAVAPMVSPPGPVVAGPLPAVDKAFNLLTAQASSAVMAKRSKKLAPARR